MHIFCAYLNSNSCILLFSFLFSDKIQQFLENPGTEVTNYLRSLTNILKALLHPLTKYRCGEIVVKVAKLSYEFLQPRVQAFLSRVPSYYSGIRQRIAANEYIQASFELLKKGYLMVIIFYIIILKIHKFTSNTCLYT